MDVEEYLDEVNELAFEFEHSGDGDMIERLKQTVYAFAIQNDIELITTSAEVDDPYLDTVPP